MLDSREKKYRKGLEKPMCDVFYCYKDTARFSASLFDRVMSGRDYLILTHSAL